LLSNKAVELSAAFYIYRMSFANQHIQTAVKIISTYDGTLPLHHYLKQFFAADRKYGSKDRKAISHACYCYYRLGKAFAARPVEEKVKAGIFLCTEDRTNWKTVFDEEWMNNWNTDLHKRISFLQPATDDIFPFQSSLSDEIDKEAFTVSHLIQPDLFLRIRPGKEKTVKQKLIEEGVSFHEYSNTCIALSNATKADKLLQINKEVVIQDLSSQRIAELLSTVNAHPSSVIAHPSTIKLWDCCAASGGKSILAYDTFRNIELTVSDVRPSIIENLKKRFNEGGIKNYSSFVADLANSKFQSQNSKYDLIICDAPCSGSGTWGRTPEQLFYFGEEKIDHYVNLQKKITSSVIPSLNVGGFFLYITCSVFKKENEEMVDYIKGNTSLEVVKMQYLEGYDKKADTMFAALFTVSAHG
jgi:16S rRNA (cytosine967-C5)-methyltransferase